MTCMNAQEQSVSPQFEVLEVTTDVERTGGELRQPWQTPEVTRLEIKRTMLTSGAATDGVTSGPQPG